jgi:hypothetical protein
MRYFDRYYLVFDNLKTVTPAQVAESAGRLGLTFPDGYNEYVTELGDGALSDYLRIWLPQKVEDETPEHRRFYSRNFFWDKNGPLTPARLANTVVIGNTMDGDTLVFHPDRPDDVFVLPRHDKQIYRIGPGLDAAIDWLCDSGVLTRPMTFRYFEPEGERERTERSIRLPYETVRDAVVNLGLHDHVAFEERPDDQEKVFDVTIKVGNDYEDVEHEDASIMLLIKDIGGDVTVTNGSSFEPDLTSVSISYVGGRDCVKRDRLLGLLDDLESRGRPGTRRKQ